MNSQHSLNSFSFDFIDPELSSSPGEQGDGKWGVVGVDLVLCLLDFLLSLFESVFDLYLKVFLNELSGD